MTKSTCDGGGMGSHVDKVSFVLLVIFVKFFLSSRFVNLCFPSRIVLALTCFVVWLTPTSSVFFLFGHTNHTCGLYAKLHSLDLCDVSDWNLRWLPEKRKSFVEQGHWIKSR